MIYTALSNITHDGVAYKKGQVIKDITPVQAKALINSGVLTTDEVVEDEEKSAPADTTPAVPSAPEDATTDKDADLGAGDNL